MPLDILNSLCGVYNSVQQISVPNANLPAGDIFIIVGNDHENAYRQISSISHPALQNPSRISIYQRQQNTTYYTLDVWRSKCTGGAGTLQVNLNATAYFNAFWVVHATDIGELLQDIRRTNFSWMNTVQLTPTASDATHGIALMYGGTGSQTSGVLIQGWSDDVQQCDPGSWRDGRIATKVASSLAGSTVSFVGTDGTSHIALCQLLVFATAAQQKKLGALLGSRRV